MRNRIVVYYLSPIKKKIRDMLAEELTGLLAEFGIGKLKEGPYY